MLGWDGMRLWNGRTRPGMSEQYEIPKVQRGSKRHLGRRGDRDGDHIDSACYVVNSRERRYYVLIMGWMRNRFLRIRKKKRKKKKKMMMMMMKKEKKNEEFFQGDH